MSASIVKVIVAGLLFLHGIAHVGPIGTYLWIRFRPSDSTGAWISAKSWIAPALPQSAATGIATTFWAVALVGFVGAALSFWGVVLPGDLWRQLALGSAIVSAAGIIAFLGTWPVFNTAAALAVNVLILATQLWLHWPPVSMFGK